MRDGTAGAEWTSELMPISFLLFLLSFFFFLSRVGPEHIWKKKGPGKKEKLRT